MVELAGLLSNPDLALTLGGLLQRLGPKPAGVDPIETADGCRPPQGQVLRAIKDILAEHPEGLHVSEARRLVEERLGRELSRSTVKGALAEHAGPDGIFRKRRRGVYVMPMSHRKP
jgi:hypothetical protein